MRGHPPVFSVATPKATDQALVVGSGIGRLARAATRSIAAASPSQPLKGTASPDGSQSRPWIDSPRPASSNCRMIGVGSLMPTRIA